MSGCYAILVAAGRGTRLPGDVPKQYRTVGGEPILRRSARAFAGHPAIAGVRVVIHPDDGALYDRAVGDLGLLPPVNGGATRQESVRNGIESLAAFMPEAIMIHDAARPFVAPASITAAREALATSDGAIVAIPVFDSLKRAGNGKLEAVDRRDLWRAQTPQAFRYEAIRAAHRAAAGRDLTDDAAVAEAEGRFAVLLDGRPVRFPGGGQLRVAARPLAEAIAAEWNAAGGAKGEEFSHEEVPLTRLVGTAEERIAPDPAPTVAALARYGETDLLCYRAEERRLAERQAAEWDPLLAWAAQALDAPLRVTSGIMPVTQPAHALHALEKAVAAHPPVELSALGVAVPALGSLVLGLALVAGRLDAGQAHALATLDERFQEEFWGLDSEAEQRRERIAADVALSARLVALSRG